MAHQNTTSSSATAQNAATDSVAPGDQPRDGERGAEPRSYADGAPETLSAAPPAASEVAD